MAANSNKTLLNLGKITKKGRNKFTRFIHV